MTHRTARIILFASLTLLLGSVGTLVSIASAENMNSNSYTIQFGNFNITSGEKSSDSYTVTDTVGQTGAGPYGEYGTSNYFVGGGFQYIYQIPEFEFAISTTSIDFGELIIGQHATQNHTMSISTRGAGGYAVYARAAHALRHQTGAATIPHTSCDASNCTLTTAEVWTNPAVAGFGYNMSGTNVPADFTDNTYFRPMADQELAESAQVVMSSSDIANNETATITYKVGVGANQQAGRYSTEVRFTAVPGY